MQPEKPESYTTPYEPPRQLLERRLSAMGVPVFSVPIREAIDDLVAAAMEEGARLEREHSG